jgi:GNAT superfamily N-acetyltransferase
MPDEQRLQDTERAFVAIWSRFCGAWSRGELHERGGLTWFGTPIRHLPYNGVIRTRMDALDEGLLDRVLAGYRQRGVQCFWALHTLSTPARLGEALVMQGLAKVEAITCMALDLGGPPVPLVPEGVVIEEVCDEAGLYAYTDLTIEYWEIPADDAALVAQLHRNYGPRPDFGVRYLAWVDGDVVGKGFLCLDAGAPGLGAIYGMSVRPQARGRGVAGALTTAMLARAREEGHHRMVLHSTEMAIGVYARAGFEPCGHLDVYATAPLWSGEH